MTAAVVPKEHTPSSAKVSTDLAEGDPTDDPNGLQFEGAFHSDISDEGVWICEMQNVDNDTEEYNTVVEFTPLEENDSDFWTVPDANLGSGPTSFVVRPIAVFSGVAFTYIDEENKLESLQTPVMLHGCMTRFEYLLRNGWSSSNSHTHQCCDGCKTLGPYGQRCEKTNCRGHNTVEVNSFEINEVNMRHIGDSLVHELEKNQSDSVVTKSKLTSSYSDHQLRILNKLSTNLGPTNQPIDNPNSQFSVDSTSTLFALPTDDPTFQTSTHKPTNNMSSDNTLLFDFQLPSPAYSSSSPQANNASVMGKVDLHPPHLPDSFPVIFDSGASLAISPSKTDFAGPIETFPHVRYLGGMANGMKIEGVGKIKWSFRTKSGMITIHSKCYYVPASKARLISPQ